MRSSGSRGTLYISTGVIYLCLLLPFEAHGEATLIDGFGGLHGYGTECLSHNDDGSSAEIDLSPFFPHGLQFFDGSHDVAYVNTNGNITFNGPVPTYTPEAFPVADQPMIAPYWADVDIRTMFGDCRGGDWTSEPGDAGCEDPPENGVWWFLEPGRMIVTWDRVGYYDCNNDLRMSFQLVLTAVEGCTGVGDFDVEFRFNLCQWHTGDASGGWEGLCDPFPVLDPCTPAQAGFDAGNAADYVEIPGSRTEDIHTILCTDSNVGEPGIWRYQIRSGQILCPEAGDACDTELQGPCAEGVIQCTGADLSGRECMPLIASTDERCDAIDNDCDGEIDEGDDLCDSFQVCDRGHCVDACSEFGCPDGWICGDEGLCIEAACFDVECEPGQRCEGGVCVGACDGVVCPAGQVCLGGRCVDPCESLECDECTVCVDGICEVRCQWADCSDDETCQDDGRCVPTACVDMTCEPGTICRDGTCVDACEGAACPRGEVCEAGVCVPEPEQPEPDGGPPTDASPDADMTPTSDGGSDAGPTGDGGSDGGVETDTGDQGDSPSEGCACKPSVAGAAPPSGGLVALLVGLGLMALLQLRRR